MSSEQPAVRPASTRKYLIAAALAAVGVGLFFAGYEVGEKRTADNCASIQAAEKQADSQAQAIATNPTDPKGRGAWMNVAHLVSQNPGCFSPEDRAGAATILDGIAQAAAAGH
jgi:hypothetical protein